ncbi:MAG: glycosyltransferase family 4 protein [Chloroflexota bacterium]
MVGVRIGVDCRIAHYTPGGTGVYTRRLVQALASLPDMAGDELVLLEAARSRQPLAPNARRGRLFTPSHHRWEQQLLPLELLPRRLDVLHSPDYIPPFLRSCRSVITVHDLAFLRWPELLTPDSRAYFNGRIAGAVRSADAIIAVSQATKQDLLDLLDAPAEKVRVIHEAPGFDVAASEPAEVEVFSVPDGKIRASHDAGSSGQEPSAIERWLDAERLPRDYVLFVGMFEPRKNLPRLIEAFAEVRGRGYTGQLLLAGSPGWLAEPVLEAVERHSGYVLSRPFDPRLYQGARVLAFPSLYEGFGLPVLEAMACGIPVLTSNVSSLPEIAGDAALLVDPLDVSAIAEGLWRLLNEAQLAQQMSEKGLERAKQFSWRRAALETLDVYHSLA